MQKNSEMIYPVITENTKKLPVYLTGIGIQTGENICRREGYKDYQITYIAKGNGVFSSGGKTVSLYEGDCFVFRPDIPHSYKSLSDEFLDFWITFGGEAAESLFNLICREDTETFSIENSVEQKSIFEKLKNSAKFPDSFYDEKNSALVYSYIIKTAENKRNNSMGIKRRKFLPVLEYVEKNYKTVISLDELASILGLSRYRFCSAFKEAFGTSPIKYLIQMRIQKAKELLLTENAATVAEVAAAVGFNDVSYFCSAFKNQEGVTPSQFKNFKKN